jgi:hypothetical protein
MEEYLSVRSNSHLHVISRVLVDLLFRGGSFHSPELIISVQEVFICSLHHPRGNCSL